MQAISPVEAIQRLNEPVLVEMRVRRTKSCTCSSQFFLDCEENHRDPADYFKDKTIRVQGVVILKEGWPYIEVDDPGQIEIVG